jgi:hypothetical protein
MNIQTVKANIRNTIEGKEHLLDQYQRSLELGMLYEQKIAVTAASEFVKLNIDELKKILKDLETCIEIPEVDKVDRAFKRPYNTYINNALRN